MATGKSTKSELSLGVEGKVSNNRKGRKRLPDLDRYLITTAQLSKELKRWKELQKAIAKKELTVEKGGKSKRLNPYRIERDKLEEQVYNDITELQSLFDEEYGFALDRKNKMRATIDAPGKETKTTYRLDAETEINQLRKELSNEKNVKEEVSLRLQSIEARYKQLTEQLENERKYKENWTKSEDEKVQTKKKITELSRKIDEYENEKVALKLSHKEELGALKEENRKLIEERAKEQELQQRQESSTEHKENDNAKEEIERLKRKIEEYLNEKVALILSHQEELGANKEENRKLKARLKDEKEKTEHEIQRLKDEKEKTEQEIQSLEKVNKDWEHNYEALKDKYNRLEAKTNQLTGQLDAERKAKEDALVRLSSMASNKLRDNNPNIADLSDPNRPTKLSEQFSELYDNEWTDAYDELEKDIKEAKEMEIISYLRDILLEIHSVCSDVSSLKLKTIEEAFVKPSVLSENTKIPTELFKMIKDAIKSISPKLLEDTRKVVLGRLKMKYPSNPVADCLQHQQVKRYIDKCTEICWYMSIQDPQVIIDGSESPDGKFDSNRHREYTKKGPYEEFVVWPVLYLYKGGQMLSKGVAQGAKMEKNNEMTEK